MGECEGGEQGGSRRRAGVEETEGGRQGGPPWGYLASTNLAPEPRRTDSAPYYQVPHGRVIPPATLYFLGILGLMGL